jgi:hypothetical protein
MKLKKETLDQQISAMVSQEMRDELDAISTANDVKLGVVIRACIELGLPRLKKQLEQERKSKNKESTADS